MGRGRRVILFCARVYHSFMRNRCPVRAAALAYTNLLALVPLLAVAVSVSAGFLKSQGEQSIQEWIREGIVRVAPMMGLKRAAGGTGEFTSDDVDDRNLNQLVRRLESSNNPVSRYLWDTRFALPNKMVLTNQSLPLEQRKEALLDELNKVVRGGSIYETQRFAGRDLSHKSLALLRRSSSGSDAPELNHALLSDVYRIGEDALDTVTSQITNFVSNFQSGKLGVSAVLALIFVAISLLANIEATFNDIWGVTQGRGWFVRIVQYWAALTLGPLFLLSAVTLTTWAKVSQQMVQQVPVVNFFMPFFVPLIILSIGCTLLYLVMPNTKVPWKAAVLGGLVAGGLLQLNSFFNVLYVSRVFTYKQIYGSMAALPLFLLGLYLSWMLVLLGAQVTYAYQNRQAYVQERKAETISQRGREFMAARIMTHISQRFSSAKPPPTACEMAQDLTIPLRLVGQIVAALTQAGLVLEVAGSESGYAPGRPLAQITFRDVMLALRVGQAQDLAPNNDRTHGLVRQEFMAIEETWQRAAANLTVEEMVQRLSSAPEAVTVPA